VKSVLAHTHDELAEAFRGEGTDRFRAGQVLRWLYLRGARELADMTDLSRDLRRELAEGWSTRALTRAAVHEAADDTRKLVLETEDGARIESVIIPEGERRTVCVSSQIGCSLDCSFCATGRMGLGRNLRPEEIVDQVLHAGEVLADAGERPTHLVFMGMGEPLLNLKNVVQAIRVLVDPKAGGLSPRRITVSTAGVVPRMQELGEAVPVRLAVSLHATTDEVRDQLVPLNTRFPIAELLEACRRYPVSRRDRISFEYTLIRDLNDSDADVGRLVQLLHGLRAKVNVIPLNEHAGSPWQRPSDARVDSFSESLARSGVTTAVRRSRGDDILAACGQLGAVAPASPQADLDG
jgi:23S rRNA (adenine2503-C2)-methyltransferase